ncbi:hypothetical protein PVAP13_9KG175913 [Panicum virgatum]|uniref:Uncharacterized protein n=1 Tax=Panicum virgatum TaxID=38727 RepID=A0A8T0NLN5_PANVG|nr:hypothetical protein PVAP13_9KG175913 [Panicum virgatum]
MALRDENKDLLQAQVELWNQAYSFMKSVAHAVALDLRIADAIRHHSGAATLPQILSGIGINPCKLASLRRLMRVLTVAGTFAIQPPEISSGGHDEPVYKLTTVSCLLTSDGVGENTASCLSPMCSHLLYPFHDSVLSMGLAAWFRNEEPGKCPYALMHGVTLWEMCGSNDGMNASLNNAMAADSRFLMRIVMEECGGIFGGIDSLVDVAGGVGGAAATIAVAFPSLKCTVLDLPHVVTKAPSVSNVQFVAGNMFESIPPANAIFLKYVLHDWADEKCIKLLKNCKQAIPSRDAGGKEWKKIFLAAGFKDYKIMPLGLWSAIELYP